MKLTFNTDPAATYRLGERNRGGQQRTEKPETGEH